MLLFGLFVGTGCKKPEDDLGLDLLNPADTLGLRIVDTTSILAWPKVPPTFSTTNLSLNLVGAYVDDRFGKVSVSTVAQLALSASNVGPANPDLVCDSLVLSLVFYAADPTYGDLDPQTISVRRLTEDLSTDSLYRNDRAPQVDATDLVEGAPRMFTPDTLDAVVVDGDTLTPQVRIRLSNALGQELLGHWGGSELADNASFVSYFKGLEIAPNDPGMAALHGGVWNFNLRDGNSKLALYYHDRSVNTPQHFDFVFGTSSIRYTHSTFDRGQATDPRLVNALTDSTLGQQEVYVQCLGGMRTEVRFPFLDRYAGTSLMAVAKAELVVPLSGTYHATYEPPPVIYAYRKASDGTDLTVPDQDPALGSVGGTFDAAAQEYRFNLTRWVQGVINGTYDNTGLAVVAGSSGVSANRATLMGPGASNPMKLRLTFTTY
ncbi:MAG: DUF4270 family protein [Flavobacteriales bacterium]